MTVRGQKKKKNLSPQYVYSLPGDVASLLKEPTFITQVAQDDSQTHRLEGDRVYHSPITQRFVRLAPTDSACTF